MLPKSVFSNKCKSQIRNTWMCPWAQRGERRRDVCAASRQYSAEVKAMDLGVQLSRSSICLPVPDLRFGI